MSKPTVLQTRCAEHPDFLFSVQMKCPACEAIAASSPPKGITYRGKIRTLTDWARLFGVKHQHLRARIAANGDSVRKAFDQISGRAFENLATGRDE